MLTVTGLAGKTRREQGFTLMELLIVMAIIGILTSTAALVYRHSVTKAREAALKQNLFHMRECINQYNADRGKYPPSLSSLVDAGYLREVPRDPFTETAESWIELEYEPREEEDEWDSGWGNEGYGSGYGSGYGNDRYGDDRYDDYNRQDSVWGDDEYDTGPGIWDVKSGHKGLALDGSSYEDW